MNLVSRKDKDLAVEPMGLLFLGCAWTLAGLVVTDVFRLPHWSLGMGAVLALYLGVRTWQVRVEAREREELEALRRGPKMTRPPTQK